MSKELTEFLAAHPDVQTIELLTTDLNGMVRGKRTERDTIRKVYRDGFSLPGSVYALDATGTTVESTGLGVDTGDADRICRPVPGSLTMVPWLEGRAQALVTMFETDGVTPFPSDPRQVLTRINERFNRLGYTAVVAVELEFYLVDRERDAWNRLQPPVSPTTGRRMNTTQVYSMDDLDDYDAFIQEALRMAREQNLPADGVIAEYAPGQFEVNLHHCNNPLDAADHAIMLKRIIRHAAREFGLEATFMAKPYIDQAGSGTHIHLSLLDSEGNNIFSADDPEQHPPLRHAIGGLLKTADLTQALTFPTINSYRRLSSEIYAPNSKTWGYDNRTVAMRIPSGGRAAYRVEHRLAGADANPYLAVAAVLAGVQHGLENKIEPGPAVVGNAYDQDHETLADNPRDALRTFENSTWVRETFGAEFTDVYAACKWGETRLFEQQITPMELDLLLPYV
ncbi:MAG: glutamine synthetase family protein [Natronospirillum sp.]|uniref:glutamine synthetase family protein n=1 Tax=Natronospirillum sp. TaxID=2812955 RepID=UPI0025D266C1|nr:glutamine synthetase family protein [Natronospirillum sp.]MCH8552799.1 glutamine synthetase family protein [Natronospirillum sp.]